MGYEDERDKIRSNRTTSQYTQYIDEEEVRSDEVAAVLRSPKLVQTPERSQTGLYCLNTNPFAIFDPREFSRGPKTNFSSCLGISLGVYGEILFFNDLASSFIHNGKAGDHF